MGDNQSYIWDYFISLEIYLVNMCIGNAITITIC